MINHTVVEITLSIKHISSVILASEFATKKEADNFVDYVFKILFANTKRDDATIKASLDAVASSWTSFYVKNRKNVIAMSYHFYSGTLYPVEDGDTVNVSNDPTESHSTPEKLNELITYACRGMPIESAHAQDTKSHYTDANVEDFDD